MGISAILAGVSAGFQLLGGISAFSESQEQADVAVRESNERAVERKKEVQRTIARNTALFAKSGVSLQGSPLFSIEQDIETGVADVSAISASGRARARSLKGQGRTALLSGIGGAIGKATPLFGSTPKKPTEDKPKKKPKTTPKKKPKKLEF